ncbi:uncharacterized protein [Rhodnius prolixus]|uniref:Uncharacterized protein n=1 Tax=Rhodnius prolixus TaxID=13249 RepID=T1I1D2_RHOPR
MTSPMAVTPLLILLSPLIAGYAFNNVGHLKSSTTAADLLSQLNTAEKSVKAKLVDEIQFTINNIKDILESIIAASTKNNVLPSTVKNIKEFKNKSKDELNKSFENVRKAVGILINKIKVYL